MYTVCFYRLLDVKRLVEMSIPSAARVAVSGEQKSPYNKSRVLYIDRVSYLVSGRGIDALSAKSECRDYAYL